MKKTKKLLAMVLILTMLFSLTGGMMTASAATTGNSGGFEYILLDSFNGEANVIKISGYTGAGGNIAIPSSINGYPVRMIGYYAFYNQTSITGITVPNGVSYIASYAFPGCTALKSVTIPGSVATIDQGTFSGCRSLENVTLLNGISKIEYSAFINCSGLISITIPASVTDLDGSAFYGCNALTSINVDAANTVYSSNNGMFLNKAGTILILSPAGKTGDITIPSSVNSFDSSAFTYSKKIVNISIPASVATINTYAFYGCTSLASITVHADNTAYSSKDGILYNKDKTTLISCPKGKTGDVTIPSSVTSIGDGAFRDCTSLNSALFMGNEPSIGDSVFNNCNAGLKVFYLNTNTGFASPWNGYTTIPYYNVTLGAIQNGSITTDQTIAKAGDTINLTINPDPDKALKAGTLKYNDGSDHAITGKSFIMPGGNVSLTAEFELKEYTFDASTGEITNYTGSGGAVEIPATIDGDSVTKIGDSTFANCTSLTSITIPGSITSIAINSFTSCANLQSVFFLGDYSGGAISESNNPFGGHNDDFTVKYMTDNTGFTPAIWGTYKLLGFHTVTFNKNSGDTDASPSTVTTTGAAIGTLPTALTKSGYTFSGWNTLANGSGSAFTAATEVTESGIVYAQWTANPSGNGGGGISPVIPPVGTVTAANTTTATTTTTAKVGADGGAAAVVTGTQVTDAIARAVAGATAQGAGTDAVVEIKVVGDSSAKSVSTTIPRGAFSEISGSNMDGLKISTPLASVTFDGAALDAINGKAAGDINITTALADTSKLSAAEKAAVGDRPVYDLTITSGNATISSFGSGSATVGIPYTLAAGEDASKIVIYYLADSGELVLIANCKYDIKTGLVTFVTDHFSNYAVGYNDVRFSDVSGWYAEYVNYLAARDIIKGSNGKFNPNASITRAEFVTILANLSGADLNSYTSSSFSDVKATSWYFGAVQWAYLAGVSEGSDGKFNPNAKISRQDMAVMIARYAEKTPGFKLPQTSDKVEFTDSVKIAEYAKDAVMLMKQAGIISGNPDGGFAPQNFATKAQAAKMIAGIS